MSIASEITRINTNIAAAYTALDGKGATLPETQNSANLADTIDTISTGGGSSSERPAVFDTVDNIVNNCTGNLSIVPWGDNSDFIIGYVFNDNVNCVGLKNMSYLASYEIPSTATIDENYVVDFGSGEKWIIIGFIHNNTSTLGYLIPYIYIKNQNNEYDYLSISGGDKGQLLRYIHLKGVNNSYPFPISVVFFQDTINLEDINITGEYTYSESSIKFATYYYFYLNKFPKIMYDYIDKNNISKDSIVAYSDLPVTDSFAYYINNDFPFIIDYTGRTSTLDFSTVNRFVSGENRAGVNFKIILPDADVTMTYFQINKAWARILLTSGSWNYIAEHAPTVENKTLTLSSVTYALLGGASGSFATTMTAKGWTIAT